MNAPFPHSTLEELTELRLKLRANGHHPVPIIAAHIDTNSAGKRPIMTEWQTKCLNADPQEIREWSTDQIDCTNTGLLCGEIVGVDIDVLNDVLSANLVARAEARFGRSPLHRSGRAPKVLLVYRVETPHEKLTTPVLIFGDDVKDKDTHAKVEILAKGQQFVAFGVHPDTRAPYSWLEKSPLDIPAFDLPLVTLESLQEFIAEAEQVLREAGGRTKAEILQVAAPAPGTGKQAADRVRKSAAFADGESFFKKVNALAMVSLSSWVPALLPAATPYKGGYRVTSKDLGRDYEEDLSIAPNGIKDWGVWDEGDSQLGKRTPIDLVVEWGNKTAPDAAFWLCERMGIDPKTLGWKTIEWISLDSIDLNEVRPQPGQSADDDDQEAPDELERDDATEDKESQEDQKSPDEQAGDDSARPANEAAPSKDLPAIEIKNGHLSSLATKAEEILMAAGVPIYQRGGTLVRPIIEEIDASRGRKTKVAQLRILDTVYLRDLLGRYAIWGKYNERAKDIVRIDPPPEIAATVLARVGDWKFKAINGVISTPTMRPDGSLLTKQGYDEATGLLLVEPPPMPAILDQPTKEDAFEAVTVLEGLLTGFPFVDDVAKACALSAMITPIVRGAFPVTPLHASRAPTAGSGKSFLWDIVAAIAIGQPMPVMSTGASEEETEKRLGAAMLAGQPLISIDNISGELGGDALCQIIERPVVEIRVLGRSERVRIEARGTSLYATGNNFVVVADVCRRVITTNLDPADERPELRQFDFDPVARVLADRGKYIAAVLTICRAYAVAGKPNPAPRLASFEGWSDTVRSSLIWLGREDVVKSMEGARAEDPERIELNDMLEAWARVMGIGPGSRVKLSDAILRGTAMVKPDQLSTLEPKHPDFYAALEEMAFRATGKRGQKPDARTLGNWLRRFKGRIINGKRFAHKPNEKGGAEWWVEDVAKAQTAAA